MVFHCIQCSLDSRFRYGEGLDNIIEINNTCRHVLTICWSFIDYLLTRQHTKVVNRSIQISHTVLRIRVFYERSLIHPINGMPSRSKRERQFEVGNLGSIGKWNYLPMQNFPKINCRMSSVVVAPVKLSSAESAAYKSRSNISCGVLPSTAHRATSSARRASTNAWC